jgi:hypothetical protein
MVLLSMAKRSALNGDFLLVMLSRESEKLQQKFMAL